MEQASHAQWKGTTDGTPWMQRTLVRTVSRLPLWLVYSGMAIFVVPGYMLFNRQGYLSQYRFFRRRFGHSPLRAFADVYANHFRFGQVILDRFAIYGGMRFRLVIEGNERFMALTYEPGGFMQVGSHVGNFELAGYMLSQDRKTINALVFGGETGTVMENRVRVFENQNLRLILTDGSMDHVFEMNRALADGEIVSMHGDRVFGSQKTFPCQVLGAEAHLPMGPFILAASREVGGLARSAAAVHVRDEGEPQDLPCLCAGAPDRRRPAGQRASRARRRTGTSLRRLPHGDSQEVPSPMV